MTSTTVSWRSTVAAVIRRRDFLRGLSAAALAAGSLTWRDLVASGSRRTAPPGKGLHSAVDAGRAQPVRDLQPQAGPCQRRRHQGHRDRRARHSR